MSELLTKIQTTLAAVDDIEKAIQERGIPTDGYTLLEYGNLIRRIASEGGLSFPDGTMILYLKHMTSISTFVTEIYNADLYEGVFTPSLKWLLTDESKLFEFRESLINCETFTAEKIENNIKTGVFVNATNQLVEIVNITESE